MNKTTSFIIFLFLSVFTLQVNASHSISHNNGKIEGPISESNYNATLANNLITVQLYTAQNYNNGGPVHDSFGINFAVGNNNALTAADALKPMNFFENLAINLNGVYLSYESRAMPQLGEVYAMYSSGYQKTDYYLKMIITGLDDTLFYLDDQFTGTSVLLSTGVIAYPFSVNSAQPLSKATNRFSIRVSAIASNYIYQNGNWTPNNPSGISTAIDNIKVMNGSTSLTDETTIKNITINPNATLKIHDVLNLKGNLTNNGNLVFVSSATGNGELGEVSVTSVITGNATVERYMKNKRSYRVVSSSVTTATSIHNNWQEGAANAGDNPNPGYGTHITGSVTGQNGFDATQTGNYSIFTVNAASQQFEPVLNTNVNTLIAGNPYLLFVRGDRDINLGDNLASSETVIRATGTLFKGDHIQDYPSSETGDFIMFGNPYQCTVDLSQVLRTSNGSTNINNGHYYFYDSSLGVHGSYVTVSLPSGVNTSGSEANQFLQPGQGGQVIVFGTAATISFNESNKDPGFFTATNRPLTSENMLTVQLYTTENFNTEGPVHDSFGIIFDADYNNNITLADAVKPMNFYENLGIDHHGTYLSLEYREMPQPLEKYQIYSSGYSQSAYTLKIHIEGLEDTVFYLEDKLTGINTVLEAGDNVYNFNVDNTDLVSSASDRFSISTEQRLNVTDYDLLSGIKLFPNPVNSGAFYINTPNLNGEFLNVTVTDLSGRLIFNENIDCKNNVATVTLNENLVSGIYLVTVKHKGTLYTQKLIKE